MAHDRFIKLEGKDAAAALSDINPLLDGPSFAPASATVLSQALPFYPGWHQLDIGDYQQHPVMSVIAARRSGLAILLDGSLAAIQRLNKEAPLVLSEGTTPAYIRFFLTHVRPGGHRIALAETVEDIPWRDEPTPTLRKELARHLLPLQAARRSDGIFFTQATMLSGTALCMAQIEVALDGSLSFTDEQVLREDLPITDDVLGQ